LGDCKWLYSVLCAHDPLRKTLYPSRLRALYDFKKEFFISKGDIFAWSDPFPAVFEYVDILKNLFLRVKYEAQRSDDLRRTKVYDESYQDEGDKVHDT
jgi:hypothetical protein